MRLTSIYHGLFETDMTSKQTTEKYLEYTEGIELVDNNVAYTNETCRQVSQHIRTERCIDDEHVVGDLVIGRVYNRHWTSTFHVNPKFKITEINKNIVTFENVTTKLQQ